MKRRPVIERIAPDMAELRRRQADRTRMAALIRRYVALADEAGIGRRQLGAAMIDTGRDLIESAQDAPGAASALGAASHAVSGVGGVWRDPGAAERVFGGKG